MLSHEKIWSAIDALAVRHGLTPSGLARRAGLDPTSFNRSKRHGQDGRMRWPSTESVSRVLDATGEGVGEFFGYLDKSNERDLALSAQAGVIPLIGFAQAGAGGFFDDAGFPAGEGWDVVDFPSSPAQKAGVYALEVQGESMMPLYRDGDTLIVEPGAQVRRGDRVVVRTRDGEVMAKILLRQNTRSIDLLSLNPEHPDRHLEMVNVEWVARIIWASQ